MLNPNKNNCLYEIELVQIKREVMSNLQSMFAFVAFFNF